MAPALQPDRAPEGWQPPGHRWGRGARTVVPYLRHTNAAGPQRAGIPGESEAPVSNPVFAHMEALPRRRGWKR